MHAQTNPVNSTAKDLGLKQGNPLLLLIGRNGSREQIDDVSHANETRDPKNNSPLSISRSDWLGPSVAMYTTHLSSSWPKDYKIQGNRKMLRFCKKIANGSYIRDLTIQIKPGDGCFVVVLRAKLNCT